MQADEERFIQLETKAAYQEDALRELSDVIARQQRELDALRSAFQQLVDRVRTLADALPEKTTLADEIPPHY